MDGGAGLHPEVLSPTVGPNAAGDAAELKAYDAEHDMALPEILADRTAFLGRAFGVG